MRLWSRGVPSSSSLVNGFSLDGDYLRFGDSDLSWLQLGQAWVRGHALANIVAGRPLALHLMRVNHERLGLELAEQTLMVWAQEAFSQGLTGLVVGDFLLDDTDQILLPPYAWRLNDPMTQSMIDELSLRFIRP